MKKILFFAVCFLIFNNCNQTFGIWNNISCPVGVNLNSTKVINSSGGSSLYIVGDSGIILKSEFPNLEYNWRVLFSQTNQDFIGISSDGDYLPLFVLTKQGKILKSVDGENWSLFSEILNVADSIKLSGIFVDNNLVYIFGNVTRQGYYGFEESTAHLYAINTMGGYSETVFSQKVITSMFDFAGVTIIAGRNPSNPFTNGGAFLRNAIDTSIAYFLPGGWQDYEIIGTPKQGDDQYAVLNKRSFCGEEQVLLRLSGMEFTLFESNFSKVYYTRSLCGYSYTLGIKSFLTDIAKKNDDFYGVGNNGNLIKITNQDTSYSAIDYQSMSSLRSLTEFSNEGILVIGDNGTVLINLDIPLSVELVSFNSVVKGSTVTLYWKTISEINNARFDIERCREGGDAWIAIGHRMGSGTTISENNYSYTDKNVNSGSYLYRLKQIDYNGQYEYHLLQNKVIVEIPIEFVLSQNYPNPFNPTTRIDYSLPVNGYVTIQVFDLIGREILLLENGLKVAGNYTVEFQGNTFSSGTYFYKLSVGDFSIIKKMILLK